VFSAIRRLLKVEARSALVPSSPELIAIFGAVPGAEGSRTQPIGRSEALHEIAAAIFAARTPGPAAGIEEMRLTGADLLF
jgi:hypothetical protein